MAAGHEELESFLEESFSKPIIRLDKQDLRTFVELARMDGVTLLDWHTRGQPGPDILNGALHVRADVAREVFERFLSTEKWYWHDWFPLGIPNVTDFLVNFTNQRQLTH